MNELETPRKAESIDDLRVGQVVAWFEEWGEGEDGTWEITTVEPGPGDVRLLWDFTGTEIIIQDVPPEPLNVPWEVFDRLASVVDYHGAGSISEAAIAFVAEVRKFNNEVD